VRRLCIPLGALLLALVVASSAGAQERLNRAGLVIQYGDGEVQTACVRFAEPEISGLELIERAGVPVVAQVSGMGAAVCKIGPDGCDYPGESCFCQRDGPRALYWAYYLREGEGWRYATQSAGAVRVRDGAVQGWAWGLGESGSGAVPPLLDIDAICVAPATPAAAAPTGAPAATESLPAATVPAPTAAPAAAPAGGGWTSYGGFALIALLLAGAGALAARRRRQ
jgi:hypothetical protein